ncbi:MAG: hypothetical protein FWE97_00480 [Dehalococcoidia bacterium]|nr:hypothetical protein [Dehalococcoidia bacterium]
MSHLADKLKEALRVTPPAMGFFRSTASVSNPRMLIVAQLALEDAEATPDIMKDMDAILLTCGKTLTAKALKVLNKASGGAPLGIWFTGKSQNKIVEGVDFVVVASENAPICISGTVECSKMLTIPLDLSDGLAHTLNNLPVESVLVNTCVPRALTWIDLMYLSRLGGLISKPLLAQVSPTISECEINMLWNAGVDSLVAPLSSENQETFKKLRATVDGLKLTAKRKWMQTRAIVPVIKQGESAVDADDDDDCGDE